MKNKRPAFENLFFEILKKEGFIFPTTDKEVEEFELRYGKTEILLPEELKSTGPILQKLNKSNFSSVPVSSPIVAGEPFLQMAAFANEADTAPTTRPLKGKRTKSKKHSTEKKIN
ncbi:MAG: hypothetical protein JST48_10610 [Bacteroidetes bacterium]|nr:hypothetical protein [Bacteroidota bacterium]